MKIMLPSGVMDVGVPANFPTRLMVTLWLTTGKVHNGVWTTRETNVSLMWKTSLPETWWRAVAPTPGTADGGRWELSKSGIAIVLAEAGVPTADALRACEELADPDGLLSALIVMES